MGEELFNFETLFETYQRQKQSSDLLPLTEEFFTNVKAYLQAKREMLQKSKKSRDLYESKIKEIKNIKKLLKDFYDLREKRIIQRAQFTVASSLELTDTTNMLPYEEELYNSIIDHLLKSRKKYQNLIRTNHELEQLEILEEVPELIDQDLKTYGPYKKGDLTSLPKTLAEILIRQNKAKQKVPKVKQEDTQKSKSISGNISNEM